MAQPDPPDSAPATDLFPQFEADIYHMVSTEVQGLTDEQLDFESQNWEWSKWSIRRNLSHMASGDLRWFWGRWGQQLFPDGLPNGQELDRLIETPYDRMLDETQYWTVESILPILRLSLELCWSVLSSQTVGNLRRLEIENSNVGMWPQAYHAHPRGIRLDLDDPSQGYISLEATFRHRYYEYLTHLYNIHRLKRAQGLEPKVEIPFEGYWALSDWDRSEP